MNANKKYHFSWKKCNLLCSQVFFLSIHFMPHQSAVAEGIPHVVNIPQTLLVIDNFHNIKSILHLHTITKASHIQPCRTGKPMATHFIDSIRRTAECIFMPCLDFNKAKRHSIPRNDVNFTMTIADIPLQHIDAKFFQCATCNILATSPQSQMGRPQTPETPRTKGFSQPAARLSYYLIYKTSDFLPFQHGNHSARHYFMDMA